MNDNQTKPNRKFLKFILLLISYALVALLVWKVTTKRLVDPVVLQEQAAKELTTLVEKVGKIMVLPAEAPQAAIIQDVDSLKKTQSFFIDAQNGDKILVFVQARKAVIYREETNQIVNVALNIGPVTDQSNSRPLEQPTNSTTTATTTTPAR
ncbi:MAG: hypothetical protein V4686_02560 [Patescibacteria group bacterium]